MLVMHNLVDTHPAIVGHSAQWNDALKKAARVAAWAKPGQLELASGGVLFLDEVGEMSLSAQAKFLRVLQEREFQRLGGTRTVKANIRVVAATNRDLADAIERKAFREDLFYRLNVFEIRIAPLRERPDDILPLAEAFLVELGRSSGVRPPMLAAEARDALLGYSWPGNVRELRNALERAAILCEGDVIDSAHLALQSARPTCRESTDLGNVDRALIVKIMSQERWNKSKAARLLGITRTQLYYRLRKHRLER